MSVEHIILSLTPSYSIDEWHPALVLYFIALVEYNNSVADAGPRHPSFSYQPAAPVWFTGKRQSTDAEACSQTLIDLHWRKQLQDGGVVVCCHLGTTVMSRIFKNVNAAKQFTELISIVHVKICSCFYLYLIPFSSSFHALSETRRADHKYLICCCHYILN